MAYGVSSTGGMAWHPYVHYPSLSPFAQKIVRGHYKRNALMAGKWVHNPAHILKDRIVGGGLALAVGQGNLMTRNFRQKPIVTLQKAEHVKAVKKTKPVEVALPSVSARRTKNILLANSGNALSTQKIYL